jgi:hypothetical protein
MQRKAPPRDIAASVVLIVAGCLIAGLGDFTFDLKGCAWFSPWPSSWNGQARHEP